MTKYGIVDPPNERRIHVRFHQIFMSRNSDDIRSRSYRSGPTEDCHMSKGKLKLESTRKLSPTWARGSGRKTK
ncbi:unnamed protein product [Arabidopsis thaliana]|uniref:Uncharacterized protein n=1 Tax=Arabidopsis thaliana TaxID=3702 RepID=A0A654EQT5_ARATH|nr:unnamed protein product [Arabidopsis thaliana]